MSKPLARAPEHIRLNRALMQAAGLKSQFDDAADADTRRALAVLLQHTLASVGLGTRDDVLAAINPPPPMPYLKQSAAMVAAIGLH